MYCGSHLSISKGYKAAVEQAYGIGGNTFQFFTRNPRGARAKALDPGDIARAKELRVQYQFGPLTAHAPYTINLASPKADLWELAVRILREDLERLDQIGSPYLVVHPGSHVGSGVEEGIRRIAEGINLVLEGDTRTMLLLEGMAGTGTEVGYTFEQLAAILDLVESDQVGFCLDTCHLFGAGYDLKDNLPEILQEADQVLGLEKVRVIHLNDSLQPLGLRKDRHANLGEGLIGKEAIKELVLDERLQDKIFILETPGGLEKYQEELAFLFGAAGKEKGQ